MARRKSARNWKTTLVPAGTAVLLTVALPLPSQAATGEFDYYTTPRTGYAIINPAPGVCLRTPYAIYATNRTDQPIQVYDSSDCNTLLYTVGPGGDFQGDFNSTKAVS
jgi:hypothetical protein